MDIDSTAFAASVISQALAMKNENQAMKYGTEVLRESLDAREEMAASLLAMMGVGQNLNVIG